MTSLEDRIACIHMMDLKDLPDIVTAADKDEFIQYQWRIIQRGLKLILKKMDPTKDREPKDAQVRILRRMIYGRGDVLCIARTGFGKSLIFHAYSILTGKITLQIIPLSKLGDEQFQDIKKLDGARPCLVTAESKKSEKDLVSRIKRGEFTHILLGPEQASSKTFRQALKSPELQRMVGLVAIDECHLIKQWQDFRDKFTMLGELRLILRDHVVWFGCTATLDAIAEQLVLKSAGFRAIGENSYQTEVVRTSIDRLDLSISVCPIPRRQLTSYNPLYFLIDEAINLKDGSANEVVVEKAPTITGVDGVDGAEALVNTTITTCTPDLIPKTIIFVDSHTKIAGMTQFLRTALVAKTASFPSGQKYVAGGDNPSLDVLHIVQTFTSHVSIHDQNKRYREFLKSDSNIRIMVATTTLGTGVNVHDVSQIINWQFPLGMDLSEIWQRVGRGGRGDGMTSKAYVFLPFWAFDNQGRDKPGQDVVSQPGRKKPKAKRQRNQLPSDRAIRRQSALQNSWTVDEFNGVDSDVESECSISSQVIESQASGAIDGGPSISATVKHTELPYWSKKEREQRSRLPEWWKRLCNDDCKREPILDYLGEKKLPHQVERITRDRCCNGCNPALNPILTMPPTTTEPPKEPTKGSRAAVALGFIDKWATEQANLFYKNRRWYMPASAFMPNHLRWHLAHLYGRTENNKNNPIGWANLDVTALSKRAPLVQQWRHWEASGADLVGLLQKTVQNVDDEMARLAALRKTEKEVAAEAKKKAQEEEELRRRQGIAVTAGDVIAEACLRDDRLAANFLKQRFLKEVSRTGTQLGRSVLRPNTRDTGTPATTLTLPIPNTAAPHGTMSPSQARQARGHISQQSKDTALDLQEQMPEAQLHSQIVPETQSESQIVPESQLEGHSLETLSSHQTTLTPRVTSTPRRQSKKVEPKPKAKTSTPSVRKRQGSLLNAGSAAKRKVTERQLLADKDVNVGVEICSTGKGPNARKKALDFCDGCT